MGLGSYDGEQVGGISIEKSAHLGHAVLDFEKRRRPGTRTDRIRETGRDAGSPGGFRKMRNGLDKHAAPAAHSLEEQGIGSGHTVIGANIDKNTAPLA